MKRYLKELIDAEENSVLMIWGEVENILDEIYAISPSLNQSEHDFANQNFSNMQNRV